MSVNSNKRKGRANANTKLGRSRGLGEKNISVDGVYGNSRLMAAVSSLVGCIVQVQVQNGTQFEGIFKTFSRQFDLVLEMPHKIDQKSIPAIGLGPAVSSLLVSFPIQDGLSEKLIFQLKDVVMVKASDVDLDYAIKDNFTDTSISKFNGQIAEKELEPWEGPPSDSDNLANLGVEDDDGANGWDANDMFKTNAEKYGVVSSYDNALLGYTVPLEKKNTEEYKLQEAKALRIAQEIESNTQYQSHIQLENGDEEDRFSAVVRPENINSNRYVPPQRRRSVPGSKRPVTAISSSPNRAMGSKLYSSQADTAATVTSTHSYNTTQLPTTTGSLRHTLNPPTLQVASPALSPLPVPQTVLSSDGTEKFVNGAEAEDEARSISATSSEHVPLVADIKLIVQSSIVPEPLPPRPERRREIDRKCLKKGRDNEIEEFKKFSSNFKLSEEKEPKEHNNEGLTVDLNHDQSVLTAKIPDLKVSDSVNSEVVGEEEKPVTNVKTSTLNPNAKEFVFNPNAKSFTPQSLGAPNLHASLSLQPHRMHTQSPVMAMPPAQVVQGIAQPVFTAMAHQYVMQAAPVSVSLTSPFATASLSQAPRFRKVPITLQPRHDMSPSMHVAAATGQPILAPSAIPTPSQLTMQYNPPPGMIHASGPPQQTMAYPQMYSVVGPRVMPPQSVGVVPTSHAASYCEAPHIPAHLFMSAHHNAAHQIQQGISGQHSNPHQSQSHAPVIHPSPSPIHQGPPHVNHSQAPPTTVMYHGSMSQHSLQTGHHNPNPSQNHHVNHPHHSSFVGGPQPMVLMSQQGIHGSHNHHPNSLASTPVPLQLHSIHGQNTGSHVGTPTHVLPQMTVIPTSAAMVSAPTAMATTQYIPHPQGV